MRAKKRQVGERPGNPSSRLTEWDGIPFNPESREAAFLDHLLTFEADLRDPPSDRDASLRMAQAERRLLIKASALGLRTDLRGLAEIQSGDFYGPVDAAEPESERRKRQNAAITSLTQLQVEVLGRSKARGTRAEGEAGGEKPAEEAARRTSVGNPKEEDLSPRANKVLRTLAEADSRPLTYDQIQRAAHVRRDDLSDALKELRARGLSQPADNRAGQLATPDGKAWAAISAHPGQER